MSSSAPAPKQDPLTDTLAAAIALKLLPLIDDALEKHREGEAPRPRLLTGPQAEQALNVSGPTLRKWRAEGMPYVLAGDAPRYEIDACLEWLRANKAGGAK